MEVGTMGVFTQKLELPPKLKVIKEDNYLE
jgi:hypothetical protein